MAIDKELFYASDGLKYPVVARPYTDDMEVKKKFFTKADMVAMLGELKKEIEELDFFEGEKPINITQELMDEVKSWEYGVKDCKKLIQEKIDKLKENKE